VHFGGFSPPKRNKTIELIEIPDILLSCCSQV
jgi:hypothetical protein